MLTLAMDNAMIKDLLLTMLAVALAGCSSQSVPEPSAASTESESYSATDTQRPDAQQFASTEPPVAEPEAPDVSETVVEHRDNKTESPASDVTEKQPQLTEVQKREASMKRLDELYRTIQDVDDIGASVEAISQLTEEATVEWLPTLHEWLAHPDDFYLREAAASAVIRLESFKCLPRLLHAAHLGRSEGHDNDGLQTEIVGVVESAPEEARTYLLKLADSKNAEDRRDAAWLLGFIHERIEPDALIRLSSDSSPRVRSAACGSLSSFKGQAGVFEALSQRVSDPDEQVRVSSVSALGYLGDKQALPLLRPLLENATPRVKSFLQSAIKKLENPEGKSS